MHRPGGLLVRTETLRVERVVSEIRREVAAVMSHETPEAIEQLVGLTIDVMDQSWEVFDGSALACATLAVWAYGLAPGGRVRAVSWAWDLRAFIEDVALRPHMRVEARLRAVDQDARLEGADGAGAVGPCGCGDAAGGGVRITVTASILIDALVLETVVLQVITGVEPGQPYEDATSAESTGPEPAPGVTSAGTRGSVRTPRPHAGGPGRLGPLVAVFRQIRRGVMARLLRARLVAARGGERVPGGP